MEGRGPKSCKVTERLYYFGIAVVFALGDPSLTSNLVYGARKYPLANSLFSECPFSHITPAECPRQTDLKRLTAFHSPRKTMNPHRSLCISIKSAASPEKCRTAKTATKVLF